MKIVDVDVPQSARNERRKWAAPPELGEWREGAGRGMGDQTHRTMELLNQTTCRKPPHARNTEARIKLLRGSGRGRNEIGNVGRIDRKRQGPIRKPGRWKSKMVK